MPVPAEPLPASLTPEAAAWVEGRIVVMHDELLQGQEGIQTNLGVLQQQQSELQQQQSELQKQQSELQSVLSAVQAEQSEMRSTLSTVQAEQSEMKRMVFDLRNAVRGKTLEDAIRKGAPKWFSRYVARCFQVAYAKPKILCTDQAPPHVKSHFFAQWCDNNLPLDSDDDPALADFVLHLDCQDRHIFIVGEASNHADIEDIERAARRSAWSGTHIRVDNACVIPCVLAETWHNGAKQYAAARSVPCLTVIRVAGEQGLNYEYLEFNLELHAAGAVEIHDQLVQCGLPIRVRASRDDAAVAERIDSRETLRDALRLLINEHWYYGALKPDVQDAVMENIGLRTVAAQQALHAAQWKTAYQEAADTLRAFMETSTS